MTTATLSCLHLLKLVVDYLDLQIDQVIEDAHDSWVCPLQQHGHAYRALHFLHELDSDELPRWLQFLISVEGVESQFKSLRFLLPNRLFFYHLCRRVTLLILDLVLIVKGPILLAEILQYCQILSHDILDIVSGATELGAAKNEPFAEVAKFLTLHVH